MIVYSTDGVKKSFYGVDFLVLSHSENTMLTKMLYKVRIDVFLFCVKSFDEVGLFSIKTKKTNCIRSIK